MAWALGTMRCRRSGSVRCESMPWQPWPSKVDETSTALKCKQFASTHSAEQSCCTPCLCQAGIVLRSSRELSSDDTLCLRFAECLLFLAVVITALRAMTYNCEISGLLQLGGDVRRCVRGWHPSVPRCDHEALLGGSFIDVGRSLEAAERVAPAKVPDVDPQDFLDIISVAQAGR